MIAQTQKQQIINHLQPYNPTLIGIFGSYARVEEKLGNFAKNKLSSWTNHTISTQTLSLPTSNLAN